MFGKFPLILVLIFHTSTSWCMYTEVLEISQGLLRGLRGLSGQNRYYGIPYAVSRRFQPPQDPPKWQKTFDAANRFTTCAQSISLLTLGTEDCLELDVYTPEDATATSNLPVMMFLHGGAYYYGSKAHYDPEFLVMKKSVAVIINYRMGVLGFLCVGNVANLGLKDQVAALRWIKNNIKEFGGDPDNVTIMGHSAGASAAAMHLLSPSSQGLFHKMVLLSGTALAPWAFNPDPVTPAFEDAAKIGYVKSEDDIIRVFEQAPLGDILRATRDTSLDSKYFKYSPCVRTNTTDPFFPKAPYNLFSSGEFNKVPIIIGFVNVEGMLFYGLHSDKTFKDLNDNFEKKLPTVFSQCSKKVKQMISAKLRSHYFGNKLINRTQIKGVVDYYSDWIAYSNIDAFTNLVATVSDQPVYKYVFSYEGDRNFAKFIFGSRTGLKGASHSDDIFYIFKPAGLSLLLSNPDKLLIDRWTTMLVNFMKIGNPTPRRSPLLSVTWKPVASNSSLALRLDRRLSLTEVPEANRGKFWLDLLCAYGRSGYVPCESRGLC